MSINRGQFKKGQIPWNKTEWIKKLCPICKTVFAVKPVRKDTAKYCSRTCSNKGSKNHLGHFRSNTPEAGRKRARRLFPCPKGFDRHHIDGNPLNNDPSNIQILPKPQHGRISAQTRKEPWNKGKHLSEEHKQKIRNSEKGRIPLEAIKARWK